MSIIFKDIIAVFDEAIHAYDRAEYSVLTFGNDTFRVVLLFMWIGAVLAFCASYYNNHYLGGFVEKLILSGATSRENAKTLAAIGMSKKLLLRRSLRAGSTLRKCVLAEDDPLPPSSDFYKGIGTGEESAEEREEAEKAYAEAKAAYLMGLQTKEKEDMDKLAFYIPEQFLGKAQTRYRKKGNGLWMLIFSIIATALVLLLLSIFAPLILGFLDNALVSFKGNSLR